MNTTGKKKPLSAADLRAVRRMKPKKPPKKKLPLAQTTDPSRPSEFGGQGGTHYPAAAASKGYTTSDPAAPSVTQGEVHLREQLPHGGGVMRTADPSAPRITPRPRGY